MLFIKILNDNEKWNIFYLFIKYVKLFIFELVIIFYKILKYKIIIKAILIW